MRNAATRQPVGWVGRPEDIAELALFLCSDRAGFITGENICGGGMTRLMNCPMVASTLTIEKKLK